MPPCYFFSFQVYETLSSSIIACEKEEFLSLYLIGERRGRVEGVKEMFMMLVFVFSFFLVGKGILIFEMLSGMQCVSQVYAVVGNTAFSYLWDGS